MLFVEKMFSASKYAYILVNLINKIINLAMDTFCLFSNWVENRFTHCNFNHEFIKKSANKQKNCRFNYALCKMSFGNTPTLLKKVLIDKCQVR